MTTLLLVILSAAKSLPRAVRGDLSAQLPGQSFTVTPDTAVATVGDSVHLRFRIRLHERDELLDSIPEVLGELPPGVRVLAIQRLTRSPDRVYQGGAQIAFYRPGRRAVPVFSVPFMRLMAGVGRATLASDSATVDISPVLPPGNPALKDIREIDPKPASPAPALALGLMAAALVYLVLRRRRLPSTVSVEPEPAPEPVAPSPYEIAIQRLDRLEEERWLAHGNVGVHYETLAQILRQYLEQAHGVGALERTTSELLWALPPHLSRGGLRDRCHAVLGDADLVKFAELRPDEPRAADFLRRGRQLLVAWHETGVGEASVDALR